MLHEDVRRTVLKALFSDSAMYNHLVLKGGNALALVYGIGGRSSLDLDFSIPDDFSDVAAVAAGIERVLVDAFRVQGIEVIDFSFVPKPTRSSNPWWGGYRVEFKLIPSSRVSELGNDPVQLSRQAMTVSPGSQRRRYRVEISKFEFVDGSISQSVDDVIVRVYSPVLIAAEKLRALLQQHPDYPQIPDGTKRSRSRDLYDIWVVCDHFALRLPDHYTVVRAVFDAKRVKMGLLAQFENLEALHRADWADVENSVSGEIESFEYYFSFVAEIARNLHAKWIVDAP